MNDKFNLELDEGLFASVWAGVGGSTIKDRSSLDVSSSSSFVELSIWTAGSSFEGTVLLGVDGCLPFEGRDGCRAEGALSRTNDEGTVDSSSFVIFIGAGVGSGVGLYVAFVGVGVGLEEVTGTG